MKLILTFSYQKIIKTIGIIQICILSLNILGCGSDNDSFDISDKEQRHIARFTEYVFFPTSPYVDKSWIEDVPPDEVARTVIDFKTETAEIQDVFTKMYNAYNDGNVNDFRKQFYPYGLEFKYQCGSTTIAAYSIPTLKTRVFQSCDVKVPWGPTPTLTEFYILPKNARGRYPVASAKGLNAIGGKAFKPGITYVFLQKVSGKWIINQLTTDVISKIVVKPRKYFEDPNFKAP